MASNLALLRHTDAKSKIGAQIPELLAAGKTLVRSLPGTHLLEVMGDKALRSAHLNPHAISKFLSGVS